MKAQMRLVGLCSGLSSSRYWPAAKTKAVGRVKTGRKRESQPELRPAPPPQTENGRLSDTRKLASKAERGGRGAAVC